MTVLAFGPNGPHCPAGSRRSRLGTALVARHRTTLPHWEQEVAGGLQPRAALAAGPRATLPHPLGAGGHRGPAAGFWRRRRVAGAAGPHCPAGSRRSRRACRRGPRWRRAPGPHCTLASRRSRWACCWVWRRWQPPGSHCPAGGRMSRKSRSRGLQLGVKARQATAAARADDVGGQPHPCGSASGMPGLSGPGSHGDAAAEDSGGVALSSRSRSFLKGVDRVSRGFGPQAATANPPLRATKGATPAVEARSSDTGTPARG